MTMDNSSRAQTAAPQLASASTLPEPATSALAELALDPPALQRSYSSSSSSDLEAKLPAAQRKTVFYLAYGSNLSASVFQGRRGIRPLSARPVHVPSLNLCFNLSGIAYLEPCMANVCLRDEAALHEPTSNTAVSSSNTTISETTRLLASHSAPIAKWDKGLIGVVYEVTPEDYAIIWATEGGGTSYADVVVPCYPLPPNSHETTAAAGTVPIKAHTLFASDPRLLRPTDPQPSLRYLNLLRTGAREHELPQPYIEYLDALQHYQVTTWRQWVGKYLWAGMWVPWMMGFMTLSTALRGEDGTAPKWIRKLQEAVWISMWKAYDSGYKKIFGDGERTVEDGDWEPSGGCWEKAVNGKETV